VLRLLTPLKHFLRNGEETSRAYTKNVEELSVIRRDTVDVVRKAIAEGRLAYVLMNNRSEGLLHALHIPFGSSENITSNIWAMLVELPFTVSRGF
jgi:hypothetical protein